VDEIEDSLQKSREIEDVNELDDTSKNPLLRNAGSNEHAAYERYLLKKELNEEFRLRKTTSSTPQTTLRSLPRNANACTRISPVIIQGHVRVYSGLHTSGSMMTTTNPH